MELFKLNKSKVYSVLLASLIIAIIFFWGNSSELSGKPRSPLLDLLIRE